MKSRYRMPKKMAKRMFDLEKMLRKAADHIDSAADVIEDLNGDDDEECDAERGFANVLRTVANSRENHYL